MNLLVVGFLFFVLVMVLFGGRIYDHIQKYRFRTKRKL